MEANRRVVLNCDLPQSSTIVFSQAEVSWSGVLKSNAGTRSSGQRGWTLQNLEDVT